MCVFRKLLRHKNTSSEYMNTAGEDTKEKKKKKKDDGTGSYRFSMIFFSLGAARRVGSLQELICSGMFAKRGTVRNLLAGKEAFSQFPSLSL